MNKKNEKPRIGRSLKGFDKYLHGVQKRAKDWYVITYIAMPNPGTGKPATVTYQVDDTVVKLMRNAYNAGKRAQIAPMLKTRYMR